MLVGAFSVFRNFETLNFAKVRCLLYCGEGTSSRRKTQVKTKLLEAAAEAEAACIGDVSRTMETVSARWAVITAATITVMALVTTIIKYDHTSTSRHCTLSPRPLRDY